MSVRRSIGFLIALCFVVASDNLQAQLCVTPDPPPPTIWSFLGIPQAFTHFKDATANRFGKLPCLERKPPVKALADPAFLESDVPALKAAAEIKAAEDLKPQKIKAVRYLAQIGCGCYDKDGKVTQALLAAMEDPTEEVRLAAIKAMSAAAKSEYCEYCKQKSCCSEKMTEQLAKIAYERDESGCFLEPSERVRRAAEQALWICCPSYGEPEEADPGPGRIEGGEGPGAIEGDQPSVLEDPPTPAVDGEQQARRSSRAIPSIFDNATVTSAISDKEKPMDDDAESETDSGAVVLVNYEENRAQVRLLKDEIDAEPGTKVQVYQPKQDKYVLIGQLEVIDVVNGAANVRPVGNLNLSVLARGAIVVLP